jgi:hypothetical protein
VGLDALMEAMARPLAERFVAAGNRPLRDLFGHGIDVFGNILGSLTICHGAFLQRMPYSTALGFHMTDMQSLSNQ